MTNDCGAFIIDTYVQDDMGAWQDDVIISESLG